MLRLVNLLTAALAAMLLIAVVAARWIGHQRPPDVPLPESDGCWLSLCFFKTMTVEDLPAALNADPLIVDGSAELISDLQPGGNYMIEFQLTRRGRPRPALLYWLPHTYNLVRDWRDEDNPALWRVGDVVRAYGAPHIITFLANEVMLHYPDRHLQVVFDPAKREWGRAWITPDDSVINITVISADIASENATQVFYPPASEWVGFGVYYFEG